MRALDELLQSWRSNPNADATIAACSHLATSGREELIREVGASAATWHADSSEVMLAVGRMYLEAGLLQEAQTSLVAAGKADPRDFQAFRYLGEVLLRRGDAVRAEKVLARARQLGGSGADVKLWHERATLYSSLQQRIGLEGIAAEVARNMPRAPAPSQHDSSDPAFDAPTRPGNALLAAAPVGRKATLLGLNEAGSPLPRFDSADALFKHPSDEAIRVSDADLEEASSPGRRVTRAELPEPPTRKSEALPASPAQKPRVESPRTPDRAAETAAFAAPAVPFTSPPSFAAVPSGLATRGPSPFVAPALASPPAVPSSALVLEHLARVGLYEPGGGAAPAWERAERQKSRGSVALLVATLLIAGAGGGFYAHSRRVKAERALEAETLTARVTKQLDGGSPSDLKATDAELARAFELDSRSQRTGRLWLENRVLSALILTGETRGIDAAVHRGRQVGLPEKDLLAGKIASFLVEGDVAGGAAMLVNGDKLSGTDPYYQLAAGAVLERAGDARAAQRYQAAVELAPELATAKLLLARLLLLESGPDAAKPIIEALRKQTGDTPSTRALAALSWVVSQSHESEQPPDAELQPGDAEKLPAPLAAVPAMVDAARALRRADLPAASKAIDSAISVAMTPALAAGLGFLAIEAGDEVVARKAALRAVQFSGVYPRARTLAARVALLGGRIDEAQKAVEGLDPASADVAVVRAVVAYESLESADLKSALEALGNSAVGSAFKGLEAAPGVVSGAAFPPPAALEELAAPDKPWGELVAIDAAIETGNLALAAKILGKRSPNELRPVHLRRLARLQRLQGKVDDALRSSAAAADSGMTLPLLLERVYELLAKDDAPAAKQLAAKYPALLGALSGWVGVLTDVASKQAASAAVRLSKLDLPPDESPIAVRVLVARALAAGKDKREKPYLAQLLKKLPKNPDVLAIAQGA